MAALKSEFKTTRIKLGKGKGYEVSPKAKYTLMGFCGYCLLNVRLGAKHQCLICGAKVKYRSERRLVTPEHFRELYDMNKDFLDGWIPTNYEDTQPFFRLKIRTTEYFIPIRYLQEFENLEYSDDSKAYERFLTNIKMRYFNLNNH